MNKPLMMVNLPMLGALRQSRGWSHLWLYTLPPRVRRSLCAPDRSTTHCDHHQASPTPRTKGFLSHLAWPVLRVVFATAVFLGSGPLTGQECRILSFDRSGFLTWTNSHTNLHCGFQYVSRMGEQWTPAPAPYWNFMLTAHSNRIQLPADALFLPQFYLRLVLSTNDLGSGFPVYQVPQRTIVVDGNTNDWSGVAPAVVDRAGDGNQVQGGDIVALYLARNSTSIYARLELTNGPPSANLYFGINFNRDDTNGVRFIFVQMNSLRCSVERFTDNNSNHTIVADGTLAVNRNVLELSVPAAALNPPSPSFVNAWAGTARPASDETFIVEARY
jgi:hypothetical protein